MQRPTLFPDTCLEFREFLRTDGAHAKRVAADNLFINNGVNEMKQITKYLADDGKEFNTEVECVAHEQYELTVKEVLKALGADEYSYDEHNFADTLVRDILEKFTVVPK